MKPGFALRLDHDAVDLLARDASGWVALGHADFSDPDIETRLAELRGKAGALAPEGFETKLILPASQILYTEIDAPGPDEASRRAQIEAALKGRTPYAVADLAYDWSQHGSVARVAVVAQVTLTEAESFAEEHGFRPVSFVAQPEPGLFPGEPFFGPTSTAAAHLPEGEEPTRDSDPVRIVTAPVPKAGPEPEQEPAKRADATVEASLSDLPSAAAPTDMQPDAEPSVPEESGDTPTGQSDAAPVAEITAMAADSSAPNGAADEDSPPNAEESGGDTVSASTPPSPDPALSVVAEDQARSTTAAPSMRGDDSSAAMGLGITQGLVPGSDEELSDTEQRDPDPAAPLSDELGDTLGPDPLVAGDEAPFIAIDDMPDAGDLSESPTLPVVQAAPTFASRRLGPAEPAARAGSPDLSARPSRLSPPEPGQSTAKSSGITGPETPADDSYEQSGGPGRRPRTGLARALRINATEAQHGTQAQLRAQRDTTGAAPAGSDTLSPFGTPPRSRLEPPARLGLGLMLVAALVVVMAAVAIWSLWFTRASESAGPTLFADAPADADPVDAVTATIETPAALPEAEPPAEETPDVTAPAEPLPADDAAVVETAANAPAAEAAPEPAADTAAAAPPVLSVPAADTIWPTAPSVTDPAPAGNDTVPALAAAAPPAPTATFALALPEPDAADGDTALKPLPAPPPPGTEYEFDAAGRIVATPDGVRTPDGFMLYAGQPPVAPTPRPAALTPTVDPVAEDPASGASPEADPAASPDAVPGTEGAASQALPTPVDPAHAALKPKPRPEALVAAARARAEREAAEAEALAAAISSATPQAVAASLRPRTRPAGLSLPVIAATPEVDDAVAAAVAASLATPEPAPTPSAPEEEIDEPEPVAAIRNIPTSVTVAKQATIKNAIDLRDISLIGVYGSSASRRALVRMPNGRYVKLKIGDRLDGGQVAAIGDSELSYVKRGKTIVLRMLKDG